MTVFTDVKNPVSVLRPRPGAVVGKSVPVTISVEVERGGVKYKFNLGKKITIL